MANHRMISSQLLRTKQMENLSDGAFRLYINLCTSADDDGFIDNAEMVTRAYNGTLAELYKLWENDLLIKFSSGIYAIKHWRVHNQFQKDRYTRTVFVEELKLITWDESTRYYQPAIQGYPNALELIAVWFQNSKDQKYQLTAFNKLPPQNVSIVYTKRIQDVSKVETQLSISKDSTVKPNTAERSEATLDFNNFPKDEDYEDEEVDYEDFQLSQNREDSLSASMPNDSDIPWK